MPCGKVKFPKSTSKTPTDFFINIEECKSAVISKHYTKIKYKVQQEQFLSSKWLIFSSVNTLRHFGQD